MPYKFLEHTADIEMYVQANSLQELFRDALAGMFFILKPEGKNKKTERKIQVASINPSLLLIDFLNEALRLALTHKELYNIVYFKKFSKEKIDGRLQGFKVKGFGEDIKAATYHGAKLRQNKNGQLEINIIFDI